MSWAALDGCDGWMGCMIEESRGEVGGKREVGNGKGEKEFVPMD